jgi:hypothetical protein
MSPKATRWDEVWLAEDPRCRPAPRSRLQIRPARGPGGRAFEPEGDHPHRTAGEGAEAPEHVARRRERRPGNQGRHQRAGRPASPRPTRSSTSPRSTAPRSSRTETKAGSRTPSGSSTSSIPPRMSCSSPVSTGCLAQRGTSCWTSWCSSTASPSR